jgi:hypothetical protein
MPKIVNTFKMFLIWFNNTGKNQDTHLKLGKFLKYKNFYPKKLTQTINYLMIHNN